MVQPNPNKYEHEFLNNLHLTLKNNQNEIKLPLEDIYEISLKSLDILRSLPYYNQKNEKLIYNTWKKLETMTKEVERASYYAQAISDKAIKFPNLSLQEQISEQQGIYDDFVHDIRNPLFIIAGYANLILNNVIKILPESEQKKTLEFYVRTIVENSKKIENVDKKNSLETYLQ